MSYKYSICYKDKSEIEYFEKVITNKECINLVQNYNWKKELQKEDEGNFAPSIEFINIEDKHCLIFSGIGENKLENFQIAFIEPDSTKINLNNEQNNKFWKNWSEGKPEDVYIDSVFTIEESNKLLSLYLNKDYLAIKSKINKKRKEKDDFINIEKENSNTEIIEELKGIDKLFSYDFSIFILGIVSTILFSILTYIVFLISGKLDIFVIISGFISLFLFIGTIFREYQRKQKK